MKLFFSSFDLKSNTKQLKKEDNYVFVLLLIIHKTVNFQGAALMENLKLSMMIKGNKIPEEFLSNYNLSHLSMITLGLLERILLTGGKR